MTDRKILAFPAPKRAAVFRVMTEEQSEWYWAGRIDSITDALGGTPYWEASAGKRPGSPENPAEIVTLWRKRKPTSPD